MTPNGFLSSLNSITGQLLALVVFAMTILLFSLYITVNVARNAPHAPPVMLFSERQLGIAEAFARAKTQERQIYLDALEALHPNVDYQYPVSPLDLPTTLMWAKRNPFKDRATPPRPTKHPSLEHLIGNPQTLSVEMARSVAPLEEGVVRVVVYTRLPDGAILSAGVAMKTPRPRTGWFITFVAVCTAFLLVWALLFLVRPIRNLAKVTNSIARDDAKPQPVEVAGPTEIRMAARALNKMQDRIHQLIGDRTRMLAAVGHDLRTPVTRLRLRADMIEPDKMKTAMLRDIKVMDSLLAHLMIYFSKGDVAEDQTTLELSSLVDSMVSEWSDAGHSVSLANSTNLTILANPEELMRMIDNAIDNAVKYADGCEISLQQDNGFACLEIVDHGPGIAPEKRSQMLQPFARGDEARTINAKSGFGLGLAIVHQIAQSYKAELTLSETIGGGLTVTFRIPLAG